MTEILSREVHLISRPTGPPCPDHFALVETRLRPLQQNEVLVRNLYLSVDPYMRGRMNEGKSYVAPYDLGVPLSGAAVGEVMASLAPQFKPGDLVGSNNGWREAFVANPSDLHSLSRDVVPLSAHLGVLGMTGMTAWVGLKFARIRPGETVFVSGAAGAVGHIVGQLAKAQGCHVIGSVGSYAKVTILQKECGFDGAFNYKEGSPLEQLALLAPGGIDIYFDNVGGEMLEVALSALRVHGRVIACGGISGYNDGKPRPGPSNLANIITKRLTITGMIVSDWMEHHGEFESQVGALYKSKRLVNKETIVLGIENAVPAFLGLFRGQNVGKMIVELPH